MTVAAPPEAPPLLYHRGSLRSKLVAKLTGLSTQTLQHWHASALQEATREPGERGTPRRYSWIDYQRLCVMASLREHGVPTSRIRRATSNLDGLFPGWWCLSLAAYEGRVPGSRAKIHVTLCQNFDVVVDVPGGQMTFRELMGSEVDDTGEMLSVALSEVGEKGPLFQKHAFGDSVAMAPDLNAGQPTVLGTSLETRFIEALVRTSTIEEVARLYRIDEHRLRRATEFERAA